MCVSLGTHTHFISSHFTSHSKESDSFWKHSITFPPGALFFFFFFFNGFYCFITFSSLFSIKKAVLVCSFQSQTVVVITARSEHRRWRLRYPRRREKKNENKSSSHKTQNRSTEYKVLHQILKAAALKVLALLTSQKAKCWQRVCFRKCIWAHHSGCDTFSSCLSHCQSPPLSLSPSFLLKRSLSCLGILVQCSHSRGGQGSMIQLFTHRFQFLRWMPRSVQHGGGFYAFTFQRCVTNNRWQTLLFSSFGSTLVDVDCLILLEQISFSQSAGTFI